MKFSSFKYLLGQGWNNFKNNRLMSVASVAVVSACLLLVGVFGSLAINVNSFVQYLGRQNEVVVYVKTGTEQRTIEAMNERIKNDESVSSYTFVSKEEALEEQMGYMGRYESLLEGYKGDNNPLPPSFRIHIKDLNELSRASQRFSSMEGVDYVSTPTELAGVLITLKDVTYYAGLSILLILFMVSMVVIANTIRLTVFARRKEISIMKYVGATNSFIRMPFIVEGMIIGTISAMLTFGVISAGYIYLYNHVIMESAGFIATLSLTVVSYKEICVYMGVGYLLFGWLIGGVGSALSMRKYLKV